MTIQFIPNFAHLELEVDEHIRFLTIEDIGAVISLRNEDVDMSEEDISSEMIKIFINYLYLEHMTKENQALA